MSVTAQTIAGVVTGVVKSLDDPDGLGRIQVTFPWLSDDNPESYWARVATLLAGPERGSQFLPEVEDEVLIAFDHGDLRLPYIVGYLWNGSQHPPHTEQKRRTLKTVSGHTLEFDDTEGSERIALQFKGDLPSVTIDQNAISIKFSDSSYIELTAAELKIVNSTLVSINP